MNLTKKRKIKFVDETPKEFHFMRDHPSHDYAILGGLWGCKLTPKVLSKFGIKAIHVTWSVTLTGRLPIQFIFFLAVQKKWLFWLDNFFNLSLSEIKQSQNHFNKPICIKLVIFQSLLGQLPGQFVCFFTRKKSLQLGCSKITGLLSNAN